MRSTPRPRNSTRCRRGIGLLAALALGASAATVAAQPAAGPDAAKMQQLQKMMKKQIGLMKPELRKKVMGLSPDTKMALITIYSQHSRHSDALTLRQVMQEVLADFQSVMDGVVTDNGEQTAAAARRLANHRIPRGGLLPYLRPEDVTDEKIAMLVPFNNAVEGNAKRLAAAADKGDMDTAARLMGDVANGCVACHQVFRGQPGVSDQLQ